MRDTHYALVHPDEEFTLQDLVIEPHPLGGYTLHFSRYGETEKHPHPYWRPSPEAAREAALEICLGWGRYAQGDESYDLKPEGYTVQVGDGQWLLAEVQVPVPAKEPAAA